MKKQLLISIMVIGIAFTLLGVGTFSQFSDIEVSSGNTLTSGTIDIAIDDENPWVSTYDETLKDMKPCQVRFVEFVIKNVGENPAVIWKHIDITGFGTGIISEPECTDQGGIWDDTSKTCDWQNNIDMNDIYNHITYDLIVNGITIIPEEWHITLGDINCLWIPLGRLGPGATMTVKQSYHLQMETGNEYQGDELTFDIELYAEQLNGPGPGPTNIGLILENKDANWDPIIDGRWGILTYISAFPTFDYNFRGFGLNPSTDYSLIYYADPWPGDNPGALIGSGTTDATGKLILSGTPDLGMDLPDSGDANYPAGAKIWLVESNDYDGTKMIAWNVGNYLFESNLITYDDTS